MIGKILTNEYDIRKAVVLKLLEQGIDRSDIRIEIPIGTNSSGGRCDIVLLHNDMLGCIELKSGKDKVKKDDIKSQLKPYKRAFDYVGVVACSTHNKDDLPYGALYHFSNENIVGYKPFKFDPVIRDSNIYISLSHHKSAITSPPDMLNLLWKKDVCDIIGKKNITRSSVLSDWKENKSLSEIRPLVINALRTRPLNAWEESFWNRYDNDTIKE